MNENCSRVRQYLTLIPFVSRETLTRDYNMDREACTYISFYLVKLDPGTHFSLEPQSSSSHLIFHHCSRRISNSKQNSDGIDFY